MDIFGSIMLGIWLTLVCVVDVVRSTYYSSSITSSEYYATLQIGVGTPEQYFDVLLDTTNNKTWIFNSSTSLDSSQEGFFISSSATWVSSSDTFDYTYENGTTNGTLGTDVLWFSSFNLTDQEIGLGLYDDDFFEYVDVSGALSLCRSSDVISNLVSSEESINAEITIDIDSDKIYLGTYDGSYENSTEVATVTDVSSIDDYWSYSFDTMSTNSVASLLSCDDNCYGIIDSASPYLTFAMSTSDFNSLWENIAGSDNCEKATLECDSEDDIANYIKFTIGNSTFYMERDDYYYDDKLHILRTDNIYGNDKVIFFGRPLLSTLNVKLNAGNDTITFSYNESSSNSAAKWKTVYIVAGCVVAFALIFFGIFFWKFKIPPPTHGTTEEQVETRALLGQQPLGAQPADSQALVQSSGPPQAVGSSMGASQTTDPDELRRRRLQFLEQQQQEENQE